MAKLNLDWGKPQTKDAPKHGYGAFKEEDKDSIFALIGVPETKRERPILLFVENGETKFAADNDKINSTVLRDERVMIGAKFYTLLRTQWANVDARLEKALGENFGGENRTPTFFAFGTDGQMIGKVADHYSPGKLSELMADGIKREFKSNLQEVVKRVQGVLSQVDKLEGKKKAVDAAAAKASLSDAKKEEIENRRKALASEASDLNKQESEIYANAMKRESKNRPGAAKDKVSKS